MLNYVVPLDQIVQPTGDVNTDAVVYVGALIAVVILGIVGIWNNWLKT